MSTIDLTDAERIVVRPRSRTIGALVDGIDQGQRSSDAAIDVVRQALLDRKVLCFRDQDVTTEQHLDFARRFGGLEVHPFAESKPGHPEVHS